MSAPPLVELQPPDWLGTPLTGAGQPGDTGGLDTVAIGSDIVNGADDVMAGQFGPFNEVGGIATFFNQYEHSIAQCWPLRLHEAIVAGAIDMGLGGLAVAGPAAPLVPIVDALVLAPLSREKGLSLGLADNINGALRGLTAVVDSRMPGGGGEESAARARARAETGRLGELSRVVMSIIHRFRGTDVS